MQTSTKRVEFTRANIDLCQCTNCPVQKASACVSGKVAAMRGSEDVPPKADVPNVYCSQGTASCDDLDFSQRCICPTCQVWAQNGLNNYKYCQNGDASRIG